MIFNLNQMQNHIMGNLYLFHTYMNSRLKKNSIDSSIFRSSRKLIAPNGAHLQFLYPKKKHSTFYLWIHRDLNKRILRQTYPIPKIQDLLLRLEGFRYGTTLDLKMGYYHIELSAKSK